MRLSSSLPSGLRAPLLLASLLQASLSLAPSLMAQPAPQLRVDPALGSDAVIRAAIEQHWRHLADLYQSETGAPPHLAGGPLHIVAARGLLPSQAGHSLPGRIELRPFAAGPHDPRFLQALRHELAHQLLWQACPASAQDALFHEAFAVASSGELEQWEQADYLSLPDTRRLLQRAHSLDLPSSRRALARALANAWTDTRRLPELLRAPLRRCHSGAAWRPLLIDDLFVPRHDVADAWLLLSRHSGAVLVSRGAVERAMPYGSVLKPLIVAGHTQAPQLPVRTGAAEWSCGAELGATLAVDEAVLRSCNGYFLDWGARLAAPLDFGSYNTLLLALGLPRTPRATSEAIGIRPTLRLSPLAVAQAYRVLAAARPDLIELLGRNWDEGTLSKLPVSARLRGLAAKTGTVRDAQSRPRVGWIVVVDGDLIGVLVRAGRAPRTFAGELPRRLQPWRGRRHLAEARVQVLGLLPPEHVEARCPGVAVAASAFGPVLSARRYLPLLALAAPGPALCLGAPWSLRFPGLREPADSGGRPYAGSFVLSPPPPLRSPTDGVIGERTRRARQGSTFVFRTSLGRYSAGVLAAEDAGIHGAAAQALTRVIAHNVAQPRHPGRPLCDTTHCQVFLGTRPPSKAVRRELDRGDLFYRGWLLFFKGGDKAWRARRSKAQVRKALGGGVDRLRFRGSRVELLRRVRDGEDWYDQIETLGCERVRGRLRLPSCPRTARLVEGGWEFAGRGEGHGLGLDVEAAKRSGQSADAILRAAYATKRAGSRR